ncbi:MAG TPA: hypothetical protein VE170_12695, partial [Candidatus Limnocylindria bacterium]|nr:hypothetical protein [Candidatus Limnocylindria bacterium]
LSAFCNWTPLGHILSPTADRFGYLIVTTDILRQQHTCQRKTQVFNALQGFTAPAPYENAL